MVEGQSLCRNCDFCDAADFSGSLSGTFFLMPRRSRSSSLPDYGVFHVSTRGVDRAPIVLDDFDRTRWLGLRRDAEERFELITYVFCLMTNHYHLIVEAGIRQVSLALHRLNGIYAQGFNLRHGRSGHLYQSRPDIRSIADDDYFEGACDYVRPTPVRAGLCARPGDWPWSGPPP
jgi:putative transposase